MHRHQGAGRVAAAHCSRCATRRATPCCIPAISYPTYEMGASSPVCARCRCRSTTSGTSTSSRVSAADADARARALDQRPGQPHRRRSPAASAMHGAVAWARERGDHRRQRRVLRRVHLRRADRPRRRPRSPPGLDGVLAVHSLSKRSNMAGLRVGFVAGDARARQLPRRDPQARRADGAGARSRPRRRGRARRRRARRRAARTATRRRRASCSTGSRAARPRARRRPVHLLPLAARRAESADDGWAIAAPPRRGRLARRAGRPLRAGRRRPRAARAHRRPTTQLALGAASRLASARPTHSTDRRSPTMSDLESTITALWERPRRPRLGDARGRGARQRCARRSTCSTPARPASPRSSTARSSSTSG